MSPSPVTRLKSLAWWTNYSHDRPAFPHPARARRRALLLRPDARQNSLPLRDALPEEYRPNFGVGLDGMLCGMLGVGHPDLIERMRGGGEDEEILEWCYARGTRLNGVQVHIWNEFARKVGCNDRVAEFLSKVKAEDGTTAETADLSTAFELMDYREGRSQKP